MHAIVFPFTIFVVDKNKLIFMIYISHMFSLLLGFLSNVAFFFQFQFMSFFKALKIKFRIVF
jgi:hypothetical protein